MDKEGKRGGGWVNDLNFIKTKVDVPSFQFFVVATAVRGKFWSNVACAGD